MPTVQEEFTALCCRCQDLAARRDAYWTRRAAGDVLDESETLAGLAVEQQLGDVERRLAVLEQALIQARPPLGAAQAQAAWATAMAHKTAAYHAVLEAIAQVERCWRDLEHQHQRQLELLLSLPAVLRERIALPPAEGFAAQVISLLPHPQAWQSLLVDPQACPAPTLALLCAVDPGTQPLPAAGTAERTEDRW